MLTQSYTTPNVVYSLDDIQNILYRNSRLLSDKPNSAITQTFIHPLLFDDSYGEASLIGSGTAGEFSLRNSTTMSFVLLLLMCSVHAMSLSLPRKRIKPAGAYICTCSTFAGQIIAFSLQSKTERDPDSMCRINKQGIH